MVASLENPYVLIYGKKISSASSLLPLLEQVAKTGRPLLLVGEGVEGDALATLVINRERGTLKVYAVRAPEFGSYRVSFLQNLAVLTGGRAITEDLGIGLDHVGVGGPRKRKADLRR